MRPVLLFLVLMIFITAIGSDKIGEEKSVGNSKQSFGLKGEVAKRFGTNRRSKLLKRQRNLRAKLDKVTSDAAREAISKKLKVVKSKLKKIRRSRAEKPPSLLRDLKRKNRLEQKRKAEAVSMDQNKGGTPQEIVRKESSKNQKEVFKQKFEKEPSTNKFEMKSLEEYKNLQTNQRFEFEITRPNYNESLKVGKAQPPIDICKLKRCSQMCQNGTCSCFMGFQLTKDSRRCVDINECFTNNGNCAEICVNKNGYHYCGCRDGFKLSKDSRTCIDIDECLLNNGHGLCEDTCINTKGSFRCACNRQGTKLSSDLMRCDDIDECAEGSWGCSHGCINIRSGAVCTCPDGLLLGKDSKNCEDINECLIVQNQTCPNCINTVGSYLCLEEGITDITCPALQSPKVGFFDCNREHSLKSSIKWISDRELRLYTPGTICTLNCPEEETKRNEIVCGVDGRWIGEENGDC